jgi:hypothetical protein
MSNVEAGTTLVLAAGDVWERIESRDETFRENGALVVIEAPRLTRETDAKRIRVDRIVPRMPGTGFGADAKQLEISDESDGVALCTDLVRDRGRSVRVALKDFAPTRRLWSRVDAV